MFIGGQYHDGKRHIEDVLTKNLRAWWSRAQAPVLGTVVAFAMTRVVAMGGLLPLITSSASAGVQGVACIADGADTLVYRDHNVLPVVARWLVDGYVLIVSPRECALASIELMSLGHRALRLKHRRTLE
jgi:hypothetical protein